MSTDWAGYEEERTLVEVMLHVVAEIELYRFFAKEHSRTTADAVEKLRVMAIFSVQQYLFTTLRMKVRSLFLL